MVGDRWAAFEEHALVPADDRKPVGLASRASAAPEDMFACSQPLCAMGG